MHDHGVAVQKKLVRAQLAALCTLPPSPYKRNHAVSPLYCSRDETRANNHAVTIGPTGVGWVALWY